MCCIHLPIINFGLRCGLMQRCVQLISPRITLPTLLSVSFITSDVHTMVGAWLMLCMLCWLALSMLLLSSWSTCLSSRNLIRCTIAIEWRLWDIVNSLFIVFLMFTLAWFRYFSIYVRIFSLGSFIMISKTLLLFKFLHHIPTSSSCPLLVAQR